MRKFVNLRKLLLTRNTFKYPGGRACEEKTDKFIYRLIPSIQGISHFISLGLTQMFAKKFPTAISAGKLHSAHISWVLLC